MAADPGSARPGADTDVGGEDPNDRVHHHARVGDERRAKGRPIVTLCGLTLSGPRPDAASLPCCPMCAAEMAAEGRSCR